MRKLVTLILLFAPAFVWAYHDHRGHNLDSLEKVTAAFTPDRLSAATREQKTEYIRACKDLAWGYLQLDGPKSVYYAKEAIKIAGQLDGHNTIYDMSILIGQCFWAKEQYDSARVYYDRAAYELSLIEAAWEDSDRHDLEAMQSRLWGTLGNFYAMQDSVEQFTYYYTKAGEIFEKWQWWEDCSILHRNIGEIQMDYGNLDAAKDEYDKALEFAENSGDSLMIAGAMYGLGRWYKESGKTVKALEYLTKANEYYGEHPKEEAVGRADTLEVMSDAYKLLYRNARLISIGALLLLLLAASALLIARRLQRTSKDLSETSAVLDETIEEIKPASVDSEIELNDREREIIRLLAAGKSTKEIADKICLGTNTILWYRKRLFAKFNVHSAAELTAEAIRRGLTE